MITCIIIDDEHKARTNLKNLLSICHQPVEVLSEFSKASEAVGFLEEHSVDCIFLDIEMPEMDGFGFLEHINPDKSRIIFVTAHSKYSIKALRVNALDYLLKPLDIDELENALKRLEDELEELENGDREVYKESINNFLQSQLKGKLSSKITIPQSHGFKIIDSSKIIKVLGEGAYSRIFMTDQESELVTKNIGRFEEILDENKFVRIHNSIIINLDFMTEFTSVDGGTVTLVDQSKTVVARRRLKHFKEKVDEFYS